MSVRVILLCLSASWGVLQCISTDNKTAAAEKALQQAMANETIAQNQAEKTVGKLDDMTLKSIVESMSSWYTVADLEASVDASLAGQRKQAKATLDNVMRKKENASQQDMTDAAAANKLLLELDRQQAKTMKKSVGDAKKTAKESVTDVLKKAKKDLVAWKTAGRKTEKGQKKAGAVTEKVYEQTYENLEKDVEKQEIHAERRADFLKRTVEKHFESLESKVEDRSDTLLQQAKQRYSNTCQTLSVEEESADAQDSYSVNRPVATIVSAVVLPEVAQLEGRGSNSIQNRSALAQQALQKAIQNEATVSKKADEAVERLDNMTVDDIMDSVWKFDTVDDLEASIVDSVADKRKQAEGKLNKNMKQLMSGNGSQENLAEAEEANKKLRAINLTVGKKMKESAKSASKAATPIVSTALKHAKTLLRAWEEAAGETKRKRKAADVGKEEVESYRDVEREIDDMQRHAERRADWLQRQVDTQFDSITRDVDERTRAESDGSDRQFENTKREIKESAESSSLSGVRSISSLGVVGGVLAGAIAMAALMSRRRRQVQVPELLLG
jgi:hypothetical protein